MLTTRIALCEDDLHCQVQTVSLVEKWLRTRPNLQGELVLFSSGQALLDALNQGQQFNLYILDVLMPGLDGIQTGLALRQQGYSGDILYLSSSPDFALDSYNVGAFFYLLKPAEEKKLFSVLDKAAARLELRRGAGIIVPTAAGDRRILMEDILFVERVGRRARYVCTGETVESLSLQTSFKETVQTLIADRRFCSCGASFVINLQRVRIVDGQTAHLTGGVTVSLPRTSSAEFKRMWGEFWLKEGLLQ